MTRTAHIFRIAAALLLFFASGCGSRESTVGGTVSLDGQPLQAGTITFNPTEHGPPAYSTLGPDGTYQLKTGGGAGLASGKYVVTVVTTAPPSPPKPGSPPMPGKLLTPQRYGSVKTTPLRTSIEPGVNTNNFELTTQ